MKRFLILTSLSGPWLSTAPTAPAETSPASPPPSEPSPPSVADERRGLSGRGEGAENEQFAREEGKGQVFQGARKDGGKVAVCPPSFLPPVFYREKEERGLLPFRPSKAASAAFAKGEEEPKSEEGMRNFRGFREGRRLLNLPVRRI